MELERGRNPLRVTVVPLYLVVRGEIVVTCTGAVAEKMERGG